MKFSFLFFFLTNFFQRKFISQDVNKKRSDRTNRLSPELQANVGMNSEWQHMFGTGETQVTQSSKTVTSSNNLDAPTSPQYSLISEVDQSLQEKSYIQCN